MLVDLLSQSINLCNTLLRLAQFLTLGGKLLFLVLEGLGGAAEIHRNRRSIPAWIRYLPL